MEVLQNVLELLFSLTGKPIFAPFSVFSLIVEHPELLQNAIREECGRFRKCFLAYKSALVVELKSANCEAAELKTSLDVSAPLVCCSKGDLARLKAS